MKARTVSAIRAFFCDVGYGVAGLGVSSAE